MRVPVFIFLFFIAFNAVANDTTKLYDPYANVAADVQKALAKAKKEQKHVLLQIGGNWCVWCYRFNAFVQLDSSLKKLLDNNYVVYHLNYSKENKNLDYLKKLGFPQRFGFPVLVVLDANGNRLHTQDSSLLEKGNGYDAGKVKSFLINWSPSALNEIFYKE
ncbi:MAG: thioredoxin family protein [Bacteroidota bacterium]|nr:thioredoxin family protein [Flavisolibacter sp.]MBD0284239.1 thioredoxin family protein [Flavisolibacter sp.]MBD0374518.1 thioredoxin family protein [Flavisolibacter sp.]MDQ3844183.1 thioredoxin family protein [Bacteroidota bacterium]